MSIMKLKELLKDHDIYLVIGIFIVGLLTSIVLSAALWQDFYNY